MNDRAVDNDTELDAGPDGSDKAGVITRTFYYQSSARWTPFGFLSPGDKVVVTAGDQADDMARDTTSWLEQPTGVSLEEGDGVRTLVNSTTLLNTDRLIRCNQAASVGHTLPAAPGAKQIIELVDVAGNAGANTITILRNGKLIDGVAGDTAIGSNGGRKRLFYDGANWRTF